MIRHHRDEASCQNPAHLGPGNRGDNSTDWVTRRHRIGSPLQDHRGAAGRAVAIRDALHTVLAAGPAADPRRVDAAIAAAQSAGDPHPRQQPLFPLPRHPTHHRILAHPRQNSSYTNEPVDH